MKDSFHRLPASAGIAMVLAVACGGPQHPPSSNPPRAEAPAGTEAASSADSEPAAWKLDRTKLPLQAPPRPTYAELDVRNVPKPERFDVKAPEGAPNVVIVLIDDVGFGAPSTFGGAVPMPTLDRLAAGGIRYNQFHTTALCSPTRAALKSGRNHHTANMGSVTETATGYRGNTGQIPNSVAPVAEMLRLNGYNTGAFGKWHETAAWEVSPAGPMDRWPQHQGFEEFYGFIGGETNQWAPFIYHGTQPVEPPASEDYHFLTDMTDKTIAWIREQQALAPDKPFFTYYAPGATHAPHHVPKERIARWKGKFDAGWDVLRSETLKRQIELGVVPEGTPLADKPSAIKDWDALSADEKKLFARQAEVFAAFLEMTDHEVGRVVDAIDQLGELDNTLIFYVVGDNGTSAEGGMVGMYNEMTYFNGVQEKVSDMLKHLDEWGSPSTYPHMAAGWAVAFNTPFKWTKQVASNYGGTRNGLVVHWPAGIESKGQVRSQFHHVIDVAPTILQASQLPEPTEVNGTPQVPMEGVSMLYSFDDGAAKSRHTTQYFEIFGNRALYHEGWLAGTLHKAPWETKPRRPLQEDVWELYDTRSDFSLSHDLAEEQPEKLAELQALFMEEAQKHHVLPIDDRTIERLDAEVVGRPELMGNRTKLTLGQGMVGLSENAFLNVKNRSVTITAKVVVPKRAHGVILAQAGRFGGWALYMDKGRPAYHYNYLGLEQYGVKSNEVIPAGEATIRMEFAYEGGGFGKGGVATLYVNDAKVAEGRIERTQAGVFSADETADVGIDLATPVVEAIGSGERSRFTGEIPEVTIEVSKLQ